MSSSSQEPDRATEPAEAPDAVDPDTAGLEAPVGQLTVEDDPQGTVDPADLAGTASDDDADVS